MRCATCGTENEPNSRFCGGCGARQPGSEPPRLAPTAKIPDDAPYPQSSARPVTVPQGPVSYAPPSIPPPAMARAPTTPAPAPAALSTPPPGSLVRPQSPSPASVPPTSKPASSPPRAAPPQVSSASGSIDVPARRPIGLMIALVVVDIGLATAGAVLLSKGLAEPETKAEPAAVEKKTEAPATAAPAIDQVASTTPPATAVVPAPATSAAPTSGAAAAPSASTATSVAAREAPKRAQSTEPKLADKPSAPAKTPAAKVVDKPIDRPADKPNDKPADMPSDKPADTRPDDAKPVGRVPTQPQDPHAAPNTEREIDAAAADSKATLAECAADHPGHGTIKIAFQVRYDGRVINAAAVENTTGNAELARCLAAEISSWRVSAHNGTSINMLRPFTYP